MVPPPPSRVAPRTRASIACMNARRFASMSRAVMNFGGIDGVDDAAASASAADENLRGGDVDVRRAACRCRSASRSACFRACSAARRAASSSAAICHAPSSSAASPLSTASSFARSAVRSSCSSDALAVPRVVQRLARVGRVDRRDAGHPAESRVSEADAVELWPVHAREGVALREQATSSPTTFFVWRCERERASPGDPGRGDPSKSSSSSVAEGEGGDVQPPIRGYPSSRTRGRAPTPAARSDRRRG